MVYIILAEGFEEIEALSPADILRRGGVEVKLASVQDKVVTGSHGIKVEADCLISDIVPEESEFIVIPGGLRGVMNLLASDKVDELLRNAYAAGKPVGAICAGPRVLAKAGILDSKRATCYPGVEAQVTEVCSAVMTQEAPVIVDGRVITSRAAGTACDFGLAILAYLRGADAAEKVRAAIWYNT